VGIVSPQGRDKSNEPTQASPTTIGLRGNITSIVKEGKKRQMKRRSLRGHAKARQITSGQRRGATRHTNDIIHSLNHFRVTLNQAAAALPFAQKRRDSSSCFCAARSQQFSTVAAASVKLTWHACGIVEIILWADVDPSHRANALTNESR